MICTVCHHDNDNHAKCCGQCGTPLDIEGAKAKAIRKQVNALCGELRPQAEPLVDAFGIPMALLAAPIAQ